MFLDRRKFITFAATLPALAALGALPARAAAPEVFQSMGIALGGTDPVAYFTDKKPVAGSLMHALHWHGAKWAFASAANLRAFEADPMRFAPRFGGYCAYAASKGYLADTIPEAWTVYEDRLYLNASLRARELWLRDIPGHIRSAEGNWPGILG